MEIIGEPAHRVLAYIEAMKRQGSPVTVGLVEAYADGWSPVRTLVGFAGHRAFLDDADESVIERMASYLMRVGWAELGEDRTMVLTRLGLAVLREANSPHPGSDAESTLEVVIDPINPFAYAQLMSKIGSFERCMIVDPYLDQDQLLTLATFPTVTRILTSNKRSKNNKPVFAIVLGSAPHLELRMADEKALHDRIVIPSRGSALMLGSSLNSIARKFGVATPLEEASSRLIRDHYDGLWSGAAVVERERRQPESGLTSVLSASGSSVTDSKNS